MAIWAIVNINGEKWKQNTSPNYGLKGDSPWSSYFGAMRALRFVFLYFLVPDFLIYDHRGWMLHLPIYISPNEWATTLVELFTWKSRVCMSKYCHNKIGLTSNSSEPRHSFSYLNNITFIRPGSWTLCSYLIMSYGPFNLPFFADTFRAFHACTLLVCNVFSEMSSTIRW